MNKIFTIVFILNLINVCLSVSDIFPSDLRVEYLQNPLAIERPNPRLSWKVKAKDTNGKDLSQSAYQILVASHEDLLKDGKTDLWDSKRVNTSVTTFIPYNGKSLTSDEICYWKVKVWDQKGHESEYSDVNHWGMALLTEADGKGIWIGAPKDIQQNALKQITDDDKKVINSHKGLKPALYLRKIFSFIPKVKRARLHITAKGHYRAFINGHRVGDSQLSPEWTDYNKTIQYQTYDVTNLLNNGHNVIGMILSTGWYSGYISYGGQYGHYGLEERAVLELNIYFNDNTKITIATDGTWKVTTGPIIYSDMLMGETYYMEKELHGWSETTYDDSKWSSVVTENINKNVKFTVQPSEPIRVTEELKPKDVRELKPGVWIYDMEQNMVGWIKIRVKAGQEAGRIQIRHAEMLNPDGSLYTLNLRSARATDTYVIDKKLTHDIEWEPHFTYHGFRYVEITGYTGKPDLQTIVGQVIHSDTKFVGKMETSHKMLNKLFSNIRWGQRGNFVSIPTDCPQRDERLGWMDAAEEFIHTAIYNADVGAFFTKYLRDAREAVTPNGEFAIYSPILAEHKNVGATPAWSDAGIIIPWTIYRMYGDTDIIVQQYTAMTKYIDYIWKSNTNFIWTHKTGYNYGDWLQVNANTPKEVMNTALFAYDALLLSKMSKIINKHDDAKKYEKLYNDIKTAFNKAFVNSTDGKIHGDTQAVYSWALAFDLIPSNIKPMAVQHLKENIKQHDWHISTGFVSVNFLNPVLSDNDLNDVAYRLLLQDSYPSWFYSILHNATTIWERWDGWTHDKGFQDPAMNSFNHYSFGSIGRWLYQYVAGIDVDVDNDGAGFTKIIIKPHIGNGLTYVNAEYDSINGLIKCAWKIENGNLKLNVNIPPNTKATVILPEKDSDNKEIYHIGSGEYHYTMKWNN